MLTKMKMMRIVALFLLVLSAFSCNKEDIDAQPAPNDSGIVVGFREILNADSRKLTLFCRTEKAYPCANYSLLFNQNFKSQPLSVTFTGVESPGICLTAVGPASTEIQLPAFNNGTYQLELNNGDLINKGKLVISDDKVDLLFNNLKGISIVQATTQRVPANTYWGTIGYHTDSTAPKVDEFLQKLADLGADFAKQTPGHYYYYEIDNNGDVITNTKNSGYYFVKAFIFQYSGNEASFKNTLKELATTYFDEMYINVETYKGERVYNWN